jgi:hypothetical protein
MGRDVLYSAGRQAAVALAGRPLCIALLGRVVVATLAGPFLLSVPVSAASFSISRHFNWWSGAFDRFAKPRRPSAAGDVAT